MTDFETFWNNYPRKVGRLNAERAWRVLKPNAQTVVAILAAVEWQSRSRQWQDVQFIPYPATWLRAGRWLDERPGRRDVGGYAYPCPHTPLCVNTRACCAKQDQENVRAHGV